MTIITILHNPRCSKSRQTLALLQEKAVDANIVEYLKTPLIEPELVVLKTKLGISSYIEMMRTKEAEFKTLGLSKADSSEEQLLAALVSTPKLLERPIVVTQSAAKIGRPPEAVLSILE